MEMRIASVIDFPVANVAASERTQRSKASSSSTSRGFGKDQQIGQAKREYRKHHDQDQPPGECRQDATD